jgi:hypothetical protein
MAPFDESPETSDARLASPVAAASCLARVAGFAGLAAGVALLAEPTTWMAGGPLAAVGLATAVRPRWLVAVGDSLRAARDAVVDAGSDDS